MSEVLHARDQALFLSTTRNIRADLLAGIDGIYDEFGDAPSAMMALGLISPNRPLAFWNHNTYGNASSDHPMWPGRLLKGAMGGRAAAQRAEGRTPDGHRLSPWSFRPVLGQARLATRGMRFSRCTCWQAQRPRFRPPGATTPTSSRCGHAGPPLSRKRTLLVANVNDDAAVKHEVAVLVLPHRGGRLVPRALPGAIPAMLLRGGRRRGSEARAGERRAVRGERERERGGKGFSHVPPLSIADVALLSLSHTRFPRSHSGQYHKCM